MGYNVSQSLISGQPPLLVFTVCLTAFGLTMVILAYVIGEQDVPNPDVQMDWNQLFKKMSSFKLCPVQNETRNSVKGHLKENHKTFHEDAVLNSSSLVVDASKSMSAVLSNIVHSTSDENINFIEVPAKVQFKLLGKSHPSSFFQVNGKIKGSLLGFTGKYASIIFNVSLNFVSPINNSCEGDSCSSLWEVCLIMNIPTDLLYKTRFGNPDKCDTKVVRPPDTHIFYIDVKKPVMDVSDSLCLGLAYTQNSKLTEMLSVHERSIVNLHLMHTSYFMFVMVMTLVCFSLIRGRYHFPKNSHSHEKVLLDA